MRVKGCEGWVLVGVFVVGKRMICTEGILRG